MLSLALCNQSGFAAEVVDSQNQNISIEQKNNTKLKQFVQTKGPVKVDFVEVIPGAFKAVIKDKSIDTKALSIGDEIILERMETEHGSKRLKISGNPDFGSEYKMFDPLYNDKDEKALKEIKNYNTESTRNQGYFIGGRNKPLRIVSPYMKKNGKGEIKLTNPVNTKDYRTRADRDEANEKELREYLDNNKGKGHDLYTARTKAEIRESLESFFKPIALIQYPINNPKDYKEISTASGFPKKIPSFAKNIHMHGNPSFLQGRAYVQLAFGGTPEQLKPYIEEAISNSKVVVSKSDISNVYVKRYIDSNMAYADSLFALIPVSYTHLRAHRYFETRKRVETERDKLKSSEQNRNTLSKGKVYPTYTEEENRKFQKQYLHRLSFNEDSIEIPDNYVLYVFDFGGTRNHPYSLGAAVSPDKNYIIYFLQQG